jgi:hypothetical protein
LAVQAFLTDEGYDPLYGARPLRRAIMKYLEDTLAEQCLSKTLYPNTKIIVTRKKVEGTLLTYTNELEVEVDFSDVDPNLLQDSTGNENQPVAVLNESSTNDDSSLIDQDSDSNSKMVNQDSSKSSIAGRASRFFRKKNN